MMLLKGGLSQTMTRYIAFLRAINIGNRRVKMDRLRALYEALGFSRVETFIASGNVIFDAAEVDVGALEKRIEAHLHASLGYEVATFLRTTEELAAVAQYQPFPATEIEAEGNVLYVAFLAALPSAEAQRKLMAHSSEANEFHIHGREVYCLFRPTTPPSPFSGALLEKALRLSATMRNITTARKLATKYPAVS